jgi:hypothetical protein
MTLSYISYLKLVPLDGAEKLDDKTLKELLVTLDANVAAPFT